MNEIHKFGLTTDQIQALEAGDIGTLIMSLACFARHWLKISGFPIQALNAISFSDIAANNNSNPINTTPEQRAFLAAGCDLIKLLNLTPQGRQAILHLFGQPVFE